MESKWLTRLQELSVALSLVPIRRLSPSGFVGDVARRIRLISTRCSGIEKLQLSQTGPIY